MIIHLKLGIFFCFNVYKFNLLLLTIILVGLLVNALNGAGIGAVLCGWRQALVSVVIGGPGYGRLLLASLEAAGKIQGAMLIHCCLNRMRRFLYLQQLSVFTP